MSPAHDGLDRETEEFYRRTLETLAAARIPFLLGGAYAFAHYTGIERHTKDLDVFVLRSDRDRALEHLASAGYRTHVPFPHWLAKAWSGDHFIDVIYGSGNGIAEVDGEWLEHGQEAEALGVRVRLTPPEEMIWSKAFVMERERYDGADVAHLLRARAADLDWTRLLRRFGPYWRVLLSHLLLFSFVYPAERQSIPASVLADLLKRAGDEYRADGGERQCLGTLVSRAQYLVDVERWGYRDGRLPPTGRMTEEEIATWTAAISDDE